VRHRRAASVSVGRDGQTPARAGTANEQESLSVKVQFWVPEDCVWRRYEVQSL
jgi:hypothetical protein